MNTVEQSIVAKNNDKIIAYLLAMTSKSGFDIPALMRMFENFEKIKLHGKILSAYHYIVVGKCA